MARQSAGLNICTVALIPFDSGDLCLTFMNCLANLRKHPITAFLYSRYYLHHTLGAALHCGTMSLTKTRYPQWLKTYVIKIQQELKLAHWTIEWANTYCSETSMAEIVIAPAQHSATLYLSNEWRKWTPSLLRATIVHELMHCHINAINEIAEEHLQQLSPKTFDERKTGLDYVNERVTDAIAEMVSVHVSLPKSPTRTQSKTLSHTLAHSRTLKSNKKSGKNSKGPKRSVKSKGRGSKKKSTKRR